jgi:D-3-phosphoglycerate dehydrogenase
MMRASAMVFSNMFPNVLVSPHNAASTEEGLSRMARQAAQNILDALDGRPDPAMMVNPEILA